MAGHEFCVVWLTCVFGNFRGRRSRKFQEDQVTDSGCWLEKLGWGERFFAAWCAVWGGSMVETANAPRIPSLMAIALDH